MAKCRSTRPRATKTRSICLFFCAEQGVLRVWAALLAEMCVMGCPEPVLSRIGVA